MFHLASHELCGGDGADNDLAGRHRARFSAIQIVDTVQVPAGVKAVKAYRPEVDGDVPPPAVKRPIIKQFLVRAPRPLVAVGGVVLLCPVSPVSSSRFARARGPCVRVGLVIVSPTRLAACVRVLPPSQDSKIKFPLVHRIIRPSSKTYRNTFTAKRPTTFYS